MEAAETVEVRAVEMAEAEMEEVMAAAATASATAVGGRVAEATEVATVVV